MAIHTEANALSTTLELIHTATNGHTGAPEGLLIYNADAVITIYVGGADVSTANGIPVTALATLALDLISGEKVYAVAASGTPSIRILHTRN